VAAARRTKTHAEKLAGMTPGLDSLASLVHDTQTASVARQALLLRLDRLPAPLRRTHHQRLARAALDPLLNADRGCLHELPAGRLAITWRGDSPASLGRVMAALGHMLLDGPAGTPALGALTHLFRLPQDGPALLAAATEGAEPGVPAAPALADGLPLDAATLERLEASLVHANVERFVRRRPVCTLAAGSLSLAWEDCVLDLAEIAAELVPGRSLTADPWLFRRLTHTLDRRMLVLLAAPGALDRARPFGVRLGTQSLVSPAFLRFDSGLPARLRGRVVIALTPADVVADPAGFAFARDFVRTRGYRMLLRGVTPSLLPALALPRLGLDLVQIDWSASASGHPLDTGTTPLVVGRSDELAALDWARVHGAAFVQGRAALPAP